MSYSMSDGARPSRAGDLPSMSISSSPAGVISKSTRAPPSSTVKHERNLARAEHEVARAAGELGYSAPEPDLPIEER